MIWEQFEMKNKKIAIIGHFGGNENFLDGQTIKTKILYDELSAATSWKIQKVDTYYKSRNPFKLIWQTITALFTTKDIIVLLSVNGMCFYFPVLYAATKVLKTRVYHDVIGGNLDRYVEKYPKFRKYLSAFQVNWVETESLKKSLELQKIFNCEVIPNFKRLNIVEPQEKEFSEPYAFCTFSRVMKEKGIEEAIDAIEEINRDAGREICRLDIFGRVDDGYQERFSQIMEHVGGSIRYMGTVPYEKSVEAIKDYCALLFPTFWDGEGFPGTIVDAFSAGLPVIASDWNCNGEIISNKRNGLLYPSEEYSNLKTAILWMVQHRTQITQMKNICIKTASNYQPERHMGKIIKEIEEVGMSVLQEDIERYKTKSDIPKFQYYYRKSQNAKNWMTNCLFRFLFALCKKNNMIDLYYKTKIGPGLYIGHPYCISINKDAVIGTQCNIHKGVTIGQENRGKRKGTPKIGNKVWIGVNATIVGNINIGNDVLIAPNSYVNCDVPSHSVVLGNPCIIKHVENATEGYIN